MKTCTISGNLSSDSAAENYPTVQICDECHEADKKLKGDTKIVSSGEFDASFGESCEFCDKTYEEELQES